MLGGRHRGQEIDVKRVSRRLLRSIALLLAGSLAPLLRLSSRRAGVALVYHSLAARTGVPELELVAPHGSGLLEAQLLHLTRTYRLVSAEDLPCAVAHRRRGERFPVAVTFDDDLSSHVRLALPILLRHGVQATFFLTGATLDGPQSFWWQRFQHALESDPKRLAELLASVGAEQAAVDPSAIHDLGRFIELLDPAARDTLDAALRDWFDVPLEPGVSADEVRALVDAGMAIGFHTRRHHVLPRLDDPALNAAFEEGRAQLEKSVGERLTIVAYPHGQADGRVSETARRAGFETGYTGVAVAVGPDDDPLLLGRLTPSHCSARHLALQIVAALLRARS
jgi:peptidoglycan/xylan/chitin deacetylase (PgdA/CDA1 family)